MYHKMELLLSHMAFSVSFFTQIINKMNIHSTQLFIVIMNYY